MEAPAMSQRDCHMVAVTAADDRYAMPLAVTVRSALDSLSASARLDLYIIDGGVSPESRERLNRSWNDSRLSVIWLQPDLSTIDGLSVSHHVSRMTYARILLPKVLPSHLDRVIYLDADLLVLRSLTDLWDESVEGVACAAAVDAAAPWLDARAMLPNYASCAAFLAATHPVPNFRELNLDPQAGYFNAGVLLVNLRQWRDEKITEQALDCLERNRDHVLWWDQYALNVVLHGRWRPLDMRWNQGAHIHCPGYALPEGSPFDKPTYTAVRENPWIVHFTSPVKPWHFTSDHPFRRRFFKVVDRTDWKGWRPEWPYQSLSEWLNFQYVRYDQWRKDRRVRRRHHRAIASRRAA
jgi:lipopolysaccharide biosynthesis glycosyltransferase